MILRYSNKVKNWINFTHSFVKIKIIRGNQKCRIACPEYTWRYRKSLQTINHCNKKTLHHFSSGRWLNKADLSGRYNSPSSQKSHNSIIIPLISHYPIPPTTIIFSIENLQPTSINQQTMLRAYIPFTINR